MLFFIVNLFAPFVTGLVVPTLLDRWAAPHQESLWLKALIAMGSALLFVTLFHLAMEASLPLQYAMSLGLASSLAGTFCSEGLNSLRRRMADTVKGIEKSKRLSRSRTTTHREDRAPQVISKRKPRSPISDKHANSDISAEE